MRIHNNGIDTPMRTALSVLVFLVVALTLSIASAQTVDHGGDDVTLVEDITWTGEHLNIGIFRIGDRATLHIEPGSSLTIDADIVEILGHISGDAAGFSGGGAGLRGRGGAGGTGTGAGTAGGDASVCGRPGVDYNAGGGGGGGGSYFGPGGAGGAGADANDGGCQGASGGAGGATTGDTQDFRMGAGAAGGGSAGGRRFQAGTVGQRGGGMLILTARSLRVDGQITVNGGNGGNGGTSPDFFHGGGGGGGGAGGSIQIETTYLVGTGVIAARGGPGGNGGQGDRVGEDSFQGAGGGGGGGGLIIIEYANRNAWQGACNIAGGAAGNGANTNGQAGPPGGSGRCLERQVNGRPTADPGGPYITIEGRPVALDGSASIDPDGDNLSHEWDCDDDGTFETFGARIDCTFGDDGTYEVQLRVTDDQGASHVATALVIVTEGPPLAVVIGPERINEGDSFTLDASGSTGFGDTLVDYAWDTDYDGTFQADISGPSPSLSHTFCDNGVYTVALRLTDSGGSTALALHRVIVTNVPPVVVSSPPTQATEGLQYEYTIVTEDPGCDEIIFAVITGPARLNIDDNGLVQFPPTFRQAREGHVLVRVLVSDDDFGRTIHEWTISVAFADRDGDQLPDTWEILHGLDPNDPSDAGDDNDGDGRDNTTEFANDTDPRQFDGPSPPRLSTPRDGAEVSITHPTLRSFRSVSRLGDPLTYEIQLYSHVDDVVDLTPELLILGEDGLGPEEGSPTVDWTVPDEVVVEDHTRYCWRWRARDTLVYGDWSELWCFFVNLGNEPPTAPTIISPSDGDQIDNGNPQLVVGNCSDPDDDPLAYTLVLYAGEGISTPVASISSLEAGDNGMTSWSVESELEENQEYCWRALCRDNEGATSPYTEFACFVVNRSNDLPAAPIILQPVAEEERERATVRSTPVEIVIRNSLDPEGDDLVYEFQLDRSIGFDTEFLREEVVPEAFGSETSWIPTAEWEDNTVYFLRVRADDGQGKSPYAVTEFLLNFENDPPTAPELRAPANNTIISSRQPTLTVVNAIDPDEDVLRYTFEVYSDPELQLPVAKRSNVEEGPRSTGHRVVTTQLTDGSYYWRARATDPELDGPWSEVGVFIVQGASLGDGPQNNGPGPDDDAPNQTPPSDDCGCRLSTVAPSGTVAILAALGLLVFLRRRR
jgi:hypothetical protein